MKVRIDNDDETIIAVVAGRVEGEGDAESLRIALDEAVKPGAKALIVDFEELDYINSAGLRTLAFMINRTQAAKMRFVLSHPSVMLREVLTLSGFDQIVDIAGTLEEAKCMLST